MEHVAIDLGGRESQVCVRAADGTVVEERRLATGGLAAYLGKRPRSRVVLETCAEGFAVADAALELGHEVRVVPGTLVRSLGVGAHGVKNDRRDAQVLSEVSCRIDLPSVHIPSADARRRKTVVAMREALVTSRTQLINSVRGYLRSLTVRVGGRSPTSFAERVRTLFAETGAEVPSFVARQLEVIELLTTQIRQADRALTTEAENDGVCRRLMGVPGVGPVTAVSFVAAVDRVDRFPDAHKLESYFGLVPGERSSSDRRHVTGITKAGSPRMRYLLVQAAWSAMLCRHHDPLQLWALEVQKRRGRKAAVTALARKLVGILYALWRDGTTYDPCRGAAASPRT